MNKSSRKQSMDAIRRAAKHLPNRLKESFRNTVLEYKNMLRIRLGADTLVDVPPMEIKFEARNAHSRCDSAPTLRSSWIS